MPADRPLPRGDRPRADRPLPALCAHLGHISQPRRLPEAAFSRWRCEAGCSFDHCRVDQRFEILGQLHPHSANSLEPIAANSAARQRRRRVRRSPDRHGVLSRRLGGNTIVVSGASEWMVPFDDRRRCCWCPRASTPIPCRSTLQSKSVSNGAKMKKRTSRGSHS
jgi:hypothetical protein